MDDSKKIFTFSSKEQPSANDHDVILDSRPDCLMCGQFQQTMKCCSRCHSAFYCSRPCFTQHWPTHRKNCEPNWRLQEKSKIHYLSEAAESEKYNIHKQILTRLRTVCEAHFKNSETEKTFYKVVNRKGSDVPQSADFQEAVCEPASPKAIREDITECEMNLNHSSVTRVVDLSGQNILLRYNKKKLKFKVCDIWDSQTVFSNIASFLCCFPDSMRLIHKGKQVTVDTLRSVVSPGTVFQVVGEPMEDASGLLPKDIEILMQQMGIGRNVAVKALKNSNGDLIDALMLIGNK